MSSGLTVQRGKIYENGVLLESQFTRSLNGVRSALTHLYIDHQDFCAADATGFTCICIADHHNALVDDCIRTMKDWI